MGRFTTNASLLRLSLRIQRRAMFVALRDFIDSFDRAIFGGEASTELPDARLYPKLHYRLADTWEKRVPFLVSGRLFLGLVSITFALPTVVNLAVGSCIPAYSVVLLVLLLVVTITDLTHVALSNEQIEKITELYRQAQTGIRDKLVRARRLPPDPARAPLLEALREHDRLLESFREVAGFRGRFLGFVVDFGVLRTFLVTVFTLLVGLWSILRGSIVFTLDSDALLSRIIEYESHSKPGTSHPFTPHATLFSLDAGQDAGTEEVVARLEAAVASWAASGGRARGKPLVLTSAGAETGKHFFQCVLLRIEPSEDLLALRKSACDAFPPAPDTYFPHISLVYGDLPDDVREGIVKEVAQRWSNKVTGEIPCDRVEIWKCTTEKTTLGWVKVGEVRL
ncbi:hypothetical protein DFJ74DRAFT_706977 [Hyaloraphidium curvatum]|nr:hypothetical protein DFJ74DRAFT_706977 [Hyaloraphidium curvatum]